MPWKKALQANQFSWEVRNFGVKKGLGLKATKDLKKDSYIVIYGGSIFDKADSTATSQRHRSRQAGCAYARVGWQASRQQHAMHTTSVPSPLLEPYYM